jgi:uncharacterized protein YbjT (DUF2867 family)
VLRHLRARGFPVRALTRDPGKPAARALKEAGAEVVRGDQEDAGSIAKALDGVYGVFAVQTPYEAGVEAETRQGLNLADAVGRAGVRHLVYSSVGSADQRTNIPFFDNKFEIEERIRALGIPHTILRPVFFMENLQGMIGQGSLAAPLVPDRKLQMIAVDDIGAFAAMAFEHPEKWRGRAIDLAGDEVPMRDAAAVLTRSLGRNIPYSRVPWDDLERAAGHDVATMWRWFETTGYHADIEALRREHPQLKTLAQWAAAQDWRVARGAR